MERDPKANPQKIARFRKVLHKYFPEAGNPHQYLSELFSAVGVTDFDIVKFDEWFTREHGLKKNESLAQGIERVKGKEAMEAMRSIL